jgi:anti-sigma B factor antagonist
MEILKTEIDGVVTGQIYAKALDASNAREFKSLVAPLLVPGGRLVIDMEKVEFVDSTGLGVLVSCLRQAHTINGEIKLCSLSKPVRALFELVRMHRVFEIFNSRDEALSSYSSVSRQP